MIVVCIYLLRRRFRIFLKLNWSTHHHMHGMFEWYWRSKEEKSLICVKIKLDGTLTCVPSSLSFMLVHHTINYYLQINNFCIKDFYILNEIFIRKECLSCRINVHNARLAKHQKGDTGSFAAAAPVQPPHHRGSVFIKWKIATLAFHFMKQLFLLS